MQGFNLRKADFYFIMKTKQQKKDDLKNIQEKLAKSKLTILTTFARAGEKGLNVKDLRQLKKDLRTKDADYLVSKKTVMQRALASAPALNGSLGMMFSYGDPFDSAKALYQFSRKHMALKLLGGYMGSNYIDEAGGMDLAKMPSKEVLIGRLVGMLSYPIRGLAVTLDQIAKQRG